MMIEAAKAVKWEPEFGGKRMLDWLTNMGIGTSQEKVWPASAFLSYQKCGRLTVVGSKKNW